MALSKASCSRQHCLLRKNKPCNLILRQLLVFLVIGQMIIQNSVVFGADQPEPEMSCYSCDQSGSEAGNENDDDLCINPNPASDENPSTTLACPESDNKCASIRLVHHYGDKVEVVDVGAEKKIVDRQEDKKVVDQQEDKKVVDQQEDKKVVDQQEDKKVVDQQEDKTDDDPDDKNDQRDRNDKKDEIKDQKNKNNEEVTKIVLEDNRKEQEQEVKIEKEDKKNQEEEDDDEDERRKRSNLVIRRKRSLDVGDTSFVEIARKGCTSEKRVKAALDCFRNLFHHPYQRYLGKCTLTQFGRDGFLKIKEKCEPGTLPKDMRVDTDRQDKFYLLLCTCEGDLCNDKELLELDKRVFIPEVKVVGNGTPWDEGWGRLGSGGAKEDDDDDEAMRKKFKSGGEIRKVGWLLVVVAVGTMVARGRV